MASIVDNSALVDRVGLAGKGALFFASVAIVWAMAGVEPSRKNG